MARSRIELQKILEKILGTKQVYFQPPETIRLKYPCIVYVKSPEEIFHADNLNYLKTDRYTITLIEKNPDSGIGSELLELEMCTPDRYFTKDNLYHKIYTLYF